MGNIDKEKYRKMYEQEASFANFDYKGVIYVPDIKQRDNKDRVSFTDYDENFAKWFMSGVQSTDLDPNRQWFLAGVRDIDNNPAEHVILCLKLRQCNEDAEVISWFDRIKGAERFEVTISDLFFVMAMTQKKMEKTGPYFRNHDDMIFYIRDKEKNIRSVRAFYMSLIYSGWGFSANSIDDEKMRYTKNLVCISVPMLA